MAKSMKNVAGDETVHYVPPRAKRGRPKVKMAPPLTPMIDVTFQLLIYFMLTITFAQQEGLIPGTLPKAGGGPASTTEKLKTPTQIHLRPTGVGKLDVVYEIVGQQAAIGDPEELFVVLENRKRVVSDESPVVIKPRNDVRWRHVVEAFNQAVRAKYKNIAFAN